MTKKILLSGVFGPFGVDDAFGRKENLMELFHNQVTKAQGIASYRFHHRSYGLYFLAENVSAPVTVLDFPSRARFERALKRDRYDAVGISFIVPNFRKAKEMARLVRKHQPWAEIILGGHGAAIEGLKDLIECDHIVRGEGIRWLRKYVGDDPCAPIRHPALVSAEHKRLFGIPTPGQCGLLVPGVGCVNGCRFCATTHFFDKKYTPFYSEGRALFDQLCKLSDELDTNEFFVMDENFLKDTARARELLACMEENNRPFNFAVFSSAETVQAFGVENLARLGVFFLWVGAESKRETYEKNKGLDLRAMVRSLRDHGICVLVSGILFLEHHTPENIQEDIDFLIDLEGVFTQFMMFTPLPGTALYKQYKKAGTIDFDLPFEEWHGQHRLNFRHANFTPDQATHLLQDAFQQEFDRLSSSVYRMTETFLRGYETLERLGRDDPWMRVRANQFLERAQELRAVVPTMHRFAHDAAERDRVEALEQRFVHSVGPVDAKLRALQIGARTIAEAHAIRRRFVEDLDQPQTRVIRYRWPTKVSRTQETIDAIATGLRKLGVTPTG
jgi:radical SAM superfamily enzyme YgiQ (UPF0313 family)